MKRNLLLPWQLIIFAVAVWSLAIALSGCRTGTLSGSPKAEIGEYLAEDPALATALKRAINRVAQMEWINFTNRPYKTFITECCKAEGIYCFTFVLSDTPDQAVSARVTPLDVTLSGRWIPPP